MAKKGLNPDGSPVRPGFDTIMNPQGTGLQSQYQLQARPDVQVNQDAYNRMKETAMATGNSPWASMMLDKQTIEQQNAMDQARTGAATSQNQALAGMAMRGGVSGGARARLAQQMAKEQMNAGQGVFRQGMTDRMNIGLQDQQRKDQMLGNVMNADFQNANIGMQNRAYQTDVDRFNVGNMLSEAGAKRDWKMNLYQEEMKKWAAGKTADAQAQAAGGGKK